MPFSTPRPFQQPCTTWPGNCRAGTLPRWARARWTFCTWPPPWCCTRIRSTPSTAPRPNWPARPAWRPRCASASSAQPSTGFPSALRRGVLVQRLADESLDHRLAAYVQLRRRVVELLEHGGREVDVHPLNWTYHLASLPPACLCRVG